MDVEITGAGRTKRRTDWERAQEILALFMRLGAEGRGLAEELDSFVKILSETQADIWEEAAEIAEEVKLIGDDRGCGRFALDGAAGAYRGRAELAREGRILQAAAPSPRCQPQLRVIPGRRPTGPQSAG